MSMINNGGKNQKTIKNLNIKVCSAAVHEAFNRQPKLKRHTRIIQPFVQSTSKVFNIS